MRRLFAVVSGDGEFYFSHTTKDRAEFSCKRLNEKLDKDFEVIIFEEVVGENE